MAGVGIGKVGIPQPVYGAQTGGRANTVKGQDADFMAAFQAMSFSGANAANLQSSMVNADRNTLKVSGSASQQNMVSASTDYRSRQQVQDVTGNEQRAAEGTQTGNEDPAAKVADAGEKVISLDEKQTEALEEFEENVKKLLCESFGVTEEELMQTMGLLGLTYTDLLDNQNFIELSMELTQVESAAELLMNEQFQQVFSKLGTLVNDFSEQMQMPVQELNNLLGQMTPVDAKDAGEFAGILEQEIAKEPEQVQDTKNAPTVEFVSQTADDQVVQQPEEEDAGTNGQTKTDVQQVQIQEAQEASAGDDAGQGQPGKQSMTGSHEAEGMQSNAHATANVTTSFETVYDASTGQTVTTMTQTTVDANSILEQFTQSVRVMAGTESSSIEMQLMPEHLGKVYVHVTQEAGMVRAQIAVQDEAVREAMSAQAASLKEVLNEQGIKVEAVEVTIASHEFEKNLEEGNEQRADEQEEDSSGSGSGRRNINLNEEEPAEGMMSEQEALNIRMMHDMGNTVDFSA